MNMKQAILTFTLITLVIAAAIFITFSSARYVYTGEDFITIGYDKS